MSGPRKLPVDYRCKWSVSGQLGQDVVTYPCNRHIGIGIRQIGRICYLGNDRFQYAYITIQGSVETSAIFTTLAQLNT